MDRYLKTANRNRCATMVHTWPLVLYSSYHQSSLRTSRTVIGNIYADLSRTIATAKTTQERNVQLNQDVTEKNKKTWCYDNDMVANTSKTKSCYLLASRKDIHYQQN